MFLNYFMIITSQIFFYTKFFLMAQLQFLVFKLTFVYTMIVKIFISKQQLNKTIFND